MTEIKSPIILAGATTMGKSAIVRELVDRVDGDIVNADKFYLYAGNNFMVGLGLERGELEDGRRRHLFGHANPFDEPPTANEYAALATGVIDDIHAEGRIAVVEGCIRSYNQALINHYGPDHAVSITTRDSRGDLKKLIEKRCGQLIGMGLLYEVSDLYENGYEMTFPVREGFIYQAAMAAIKGKGCYGAYRATKSITAAGLKLARAQDRTYRKTPIRQIVHDRTRPDLVAGEILKIMESTGSPRA